MTRNEILRRFPNATESFISRNLRDAGSEAGPQTIPAPQPEPDSGQPLERLIPGKEKSGGLFGKCAYVEFHVFSVQPCDWDNYWTKGLQDLLIEIGLLDGDGWRQLQGKVVPLKVNTRKEERTEIKIWYC